MFLVVWLLPMTLSAGMAPQDGRTTKTWDAFNKAVDEKTSEIKQIVFGPVTKVLGVLGVAYGLISMFLTRKV
jgi:hypothetical protein